MMTTWTWVLLYFKLEKNRENTRYKKKTSKYCDLTNFSKGNLGKDLIQIFFYKIVNNRFHEFFNGYFWTFQNFRIIQILLFKYSAEERDPPKIEHVNEVKKTEEEGQVKETDLKSFLQDSNVKKLLLLLYFKKYGKLPGDFPRVATRKPCNRRSRFGSNCRSLI